MTDPADVLYDIADAIRERTGLPKTTLIPVKGSPNGFAARINAIVAGTGVNPDARRLFMFQNELTPAEEQSRNLWRLDGRPLYSSVNAGTYNLFKVGAAWQPGFINIAPNRVYDTFCLVGTNKLYIGSSTSLDHILVINPANGTVTKIMMPQARIYSRFDLIDGWIYCLHPTSSPTAHANLYAINTANDTVHTITAPTRGWSGFAKVGNKWFMCSRTATTELCYLNVATHPGTVVTISNATSTSRTQHFLRAGTKLIISSPSNTDYLAVIDTSTNAVDGEIHSLPSRLHDAAYFVSPRWLFITTSSATAVTLIIRVDIQTLSFNEIIDLPSRRYATTIATNTFAFCGKLVGTKLYVGTETSSTSLIIINTTNGQWREFPLGITSTRTWPLVDDDPASFVNWNTNWVPETSGATWFQRTHLAGANLYLTTTSGNFSDLLYIGTNTNWPASGPPTDSVNWITGMGSRAYNRFFANGNILYCFASTNATNIEMINTTNNTRLTTATSPVQISNLLNRQYGTPIVHGVGAAARLYLGGSGITNIPIINLSNNTLVEDRRNLTNATYTHLYPLNDKVYVGRTGSAGTMLVLGDSVLPTHPEPVYIRPD